MSRYYYSRTSAQRPSRFRKWGLGFVFVGLALWAGISKFKGSLPNRIHSEFQSTLNTQLNPLGLRADVQAVNFIEGKGFRVSGLRIQQDSQATGAPLSDAPIIKLEHGFIHAPVRLTELVSCKIAAQRIELQNAKLTVVRNRDGQWELVPAIQQHLANSQCSSLEMSIAIQDGQLDIVDRTISPPTTTSFKNIQLNIQPIVHNDKQLIQLSGSFAGVAISNVDFVAYVDPENKTWYTNLETEHARISHELLDLIPGLFKSNTARPMVDGTVRLRGSANGDLSGLQPNQYHVDGTIRDLSVTDHRLPLPLRQCEVDFSIHDDVVSINRATGRAGESTFDLQYQQRGLFSLDNWSLSGQVINFDFTEKFHPWITQSCRDFCRDFQPRGLSDIRFELTKTGTELKRRIQANIKDMSFLFHKFPYPMKNFAGNIDVVDDRFQFDMESKQEQGKFRVFGTAQNPGPQSTYIVNVKADGRFPIDDRLSHALSPYSKTKHQLMAFRPLGHVSGNGTFVKDRPELATPSREMEFHFHDCTVQHKNFEYAIQKVNGVAKMTGNDCEFENVTGSNGTAKVRCDGRFNKRDGLQLRFLCSDVPLDEQLRLAVSPEIRTVWNGFRPHGSVGLMKVDLSLPYNTKQTRVAIEADLASTQHSVATRPYTSSVSVKPIWFPYDINNMAGKVKVGDGQISLIDMRGVHRRTWMSWQGNGAYSDEGWSVSLRNLLVGALRVDEELITALPPSLAPAISQLEFAGQLNVNGEITMGGQHQPHSASSPSAVQHEIVQVGFNAPIPANYSTEMFWDLRFDMNQAQMQVGIPVTNLFGMVRLRGDYDGHNANCSGELAIDSMTVHDAQITNVRGPIWIDESGVTAGTLAKNQKGTTKPRQVVGEVFDGVLRFDGQRLADENGRFFVQASIDDGDLKEIVKELAPHLENVQGHTYGGFRLSGDETGTHTYRGEGNIRFRDAEIYELPVMLSLLKILRVKEATRNAFDTSDVDFAINGNTIDFERIEMIGDAISLIGNGRVNFKRQIDLNFYSVMGRNRFNIPILSELYRAGSQRILWINVDGTLENPQTHRHVLPKLNDTIRLLLQPAQRRSRFPTGSGVTNSTLGVFDIRNAPLNPSIRTRGYQP